MLNSESRRLTTALESFTDESDRRYSELFNLTMEMFEDQVYMVFMSTKDGTYRLTLKVPTTNLSTYSRNKFGLFILASPDGKV